MRMLDRVFFIVFFFFFLSFSSKAEMTLNDLIFDDSKPYHIKILETLPKDAIIPENSIIFQSEDLDKSTGWMFEGGRGSRYIELLNKYKVIDYAEFNLQSDIIKHKRKKFLPLLYCEFLSNTLS